MKKETRIIVAVIVLAATLPFILSLKGEFLSSWDDGINISENYALQSPQAMKDIWTRFLMPSYLPLTYSLFYLHYAVWGLWPLPFHVTSLLLHFANGLLVFLIFSRMLRDTKTSVAAALLWLVHPLRVEAVAWITEHKTLLSTLFFLLGFLLFQKYNATGRFKYFLFVIVAYVLGLLSKLTVAFLPIVLAVYSLAGGKKDAKQLSLLGLLLIGLALPLAGLSAIVERSNLLVVERLGFSALDHILIASRAVLFYPLKTLWPASLSPVYPLWATGAPTLAGVLSLFLVILITVSLWRGERRRKEKAYTFAWLGYIITVLPVSGIIPIPYMDNSFVADRYAYLPGIFLTLLFVKVGITAVRAFRLPAREIVIAIVVLFSALSWSQTKIWKNPRVLWEHALWVYPHSKSAHTNLGTYYSDRNFLDKALYHYETAYRMNPGKALSQYNMGVIYGLLGEVYAAELFYREALRLKPEYPEALCNLGNALLRQGRIDEARAALEGALRMPHPPAVAAAVQTNFEMISEYRQNRGKKLQTPR